MAFVLIQVVDWIFKLYSLAIIARALLSWFRGSYYHPVVRFLIRITEPLLSPLRQHIPPMSGFDITPMVALLLLWLVEQLLQILILALFR